jgi:hypothetical protein
MVESTKSAVINVGGSVITDTGVSDGSKLIVYSSSCWKGSVVYIFDLQDASMYIRVRLFVAVVRMQKECDTRPPGVRRICVGVWE